MKAKRKFLMMLISLIAVILSTNLCFAAPSITSISPTSGPSNGGTQVTVYGSGFVGGSGSYVEIGGNILRYEWNELTSPFKVITI